MLCRILLTGGIRFRKGGNLGQSVKLVQVLAALWNFILFVDNPNDMDDDENEVGPLLGEDEDIIPAPVHPGLQPTNIQILRLYTP